MRALLSVHDKHGLVPLARALVDRSWEIVSTGGTQAALAEAGIPATAVSDVTGFPEILDGRVKTLHPRIHAGLLARLNLGEHRATLADHEIGPIALLACNLYPFAATVRQPGATDAEAIEQIDIGGPAMIRAAAKNHEHVLVLTSPADYDDALQRLTAGEIPAEFRRAMAAKAFAHLSAYDAIVADYLRGESPAFPLELTFAGRKVQDLRYGENPQQAAAAYRRLSARPSGHSLLDASQLQGKELSFNNLLDADAAMGAASGFDRPAAAVVKHTIPCGLAVRDDLAAAFAAALAGDPISAFGGIVALNRAVDRSTAERLADVFFEVIVAPGFDDDGLALLAKKRQLRLLATGAGADRTGGASERDIRPIRGGLLVQTADDARDDESTWQCPTDRRPTPAERRDLGFAWKAVRHVKSNAIVLATDEAVVGVGSGQPNRLESVRIAIAKAGDRVEGSVLASDAFFPFADGLQAAASAGISAIVQPGGSVRDQEVIDAANAAGVAMLFTGVRHFRH